MDNQVLARDIYRISHLRGSFKLRSGTMADEYFDKYLFESEPALLRQIAAGLRALIPAGAELLAGLEMGGIPIATALSLATGLPAVFVRKQAKAYGTCKAVEGMAVAGKQVCIIEDVVTTGGQILLSAEDLRGAGAGVGHVLCVIQRVPEATATLGERGLELLPLFTMAELQTAAGAG
ncbi:MAG: orotate phosphoribosyltransferase [Dehalococcoidia bacterium]